MVRPYRQKPNCIRGHAFDEYNTRWSNGRRYCRECEFDRNNGLMEQSYLKDKVCPNGHEYTPENTYVRPDGIKNCRQCKRERDQRYYDANRKVTRESTAVRDA